MATLSWVDWFNNHRLSGPTGHIPPAEPENPGRFTRQAAVLAEWQSLAARTTFNPGSARQSETSAVRPTAPV